MSSKKRKVLDDLEQPGRKSQAAPASQQSLNVAASDDAHFRHLYDRELDFKQLAEKDVDFAAVYVCVYTFHLTIALADDVTPDSKKMAISISPSQRRSCSSPRRCCHSTST